MTLFELGERVAEALVVDAELGAEAGTLYGSGGAAEDVENLIGKCGRRGIVGGDLEVCRGTVRTHGEAKVDGLSGGGGAMLEGEA